MNAMRVIDFRVRPPVGGYEKATMYTMPERTAAMGRDFGFAAGSPALREPTPAVFEADFRDSGIELAVIPGRIGAPNVGPTDDDALVAYARTQPRRLCVFPAI